MDDVVGCKGGGLGGAAGAALGMGGGGQDDTATGGDVLGQWGDGAAALPTAI